MNNDERIADFATRAQWDHQALREIPGAGRYIAINPMADEAELLSTLGLGPSSCVKVDLYWECRGDVRFVQIETQGYTPQRAPGVYGRIAPSGYVNLVAIVAGLSISSELVSDTLKKIMRMNIDEGVFSDTLIKL